MGTILLGDYTTRVTVEFLAVEIKHVMMPRMLTRLKFSTCLGLLRSIESFVFVRGLCCLFLWSMSARHTGVSFEP